MNRIKFVLSQLTLKVVLSFLFLDACLAAFIYGCITFQLLGAIGVILLAGGAVLAFSAALANSLFVVVPFITKLISQIRSR